MDDDFADRKGWDDQGKTQFVSMLHNMDLIGTQMTTMTIEGGNTEASNIGKTISVSDSGKTTSQEDKSGKTILISESIQSTKNIGETITIPGKTINRDVDGVKNYDGSNKTIVVSANKNEDAMEQEEKDGKKQERLEQPKQMKDQTENHVVTNQDEVNKHDQEDGLELIELNTKQTKDQKIIRKDESKESIVKTAWSGRFLD